MGGSIGGIRVGFVSGRGGTNCNFIINFIFLNFLVFHCVGGVGGKFSISQKIWEIGVNEAIILGRIIGGIKAGCVGGKGGLYCNFIINFLFLGVGELGEKFVIYK